MQDTYYHIYNRGAHKANIFNDLSDYWRMLKLLYIANSINPFEMSGLKKSDFFSIDRTEMLTDIIAYCLMPNHLHIAIRLRDVSHPEVYLTRFMRKLCTGYSNYYNIKYDHSGTIWQGPYKKKIVTDEIYKEILINYIHLNPYSLKEPNLNKFTKLDNLTEAITYSKEYEFSSYKDYLGQPRQQSNILTPGCVTSLETELDNQKPSSQPYHL